MAVNNLHRTKDAENIPDVLSGLTTREVSINGIDSEEILSVCERYPYAGQTRYTGTISYEEKPEFGRGRNLKFEFEVRSESGLLIIKSDVDASIDNILGQLNTATGPDFRIYHRLTPSRSALWEFINNSESIIEVTIIDNSGEEIDLMEIEENRQKFVGSNPIEDATFSYEYDGQNVLVRYTSGSLQIDAENSEASEYILQLFERDVIYPECDHSQRG